VSGAPGAPSPRNRTRAWWLIAATVTVMALMGVTAYWWWYRSSADLMAVRAEAVARGIPTTWADTGIAVSPAEVIARYNRLGRLGASLKDYDSLVLLGKLPQKADGSKPARLRPFLPIPQEARDHHASLDPALIAELLDLLDDLPATAVEVRAESTLWTRIPEISLDRQVVRYLGERILLAAPDQVGREADRLLRFLAIRSTHSVIELMVHISLIRITADAIAGRFHEVQAAIPDLAGRLSRLADGLEPALEQAVVGEFLILLGAFGDLEPLDLERLNGGLAIESGTGGLPPGFAVRAGRAPLLDRCLDWIRFLRSHPAPSLLATECRRISEPTSLRSWMPRESLSAMFIPSICMAMGMAVECRARLGLMAAEAVGAPWPIDPFDPAGKSLRRLERAGVLMGGYTVHTDGIDDGGDKRKDRYFPLYGPLEPPKREGAP
jgi:hypothetical protein